MSEKTKKPGLQKMGRAEIKEQFNAIKDKLGLDLRIIAGHDGKCTIVDEDDNSLEGMSSMSSLSLSRSLEHMDKLLRYQTQFHSDHVEESHQGAPAAGGEDETFLQDMEVDKAV